MCKISIQLYVFFEESFWVGIFERRMDGCLEVSKVTFGAMPKDEEIYQFILKKFGSLRFSPVVISNISKQKRNPKRQQRDVHKQVASKGMGTKAQQILKLQQEQVKQERKKASRKFRAEHLAYKFSVKQQKRKAKHKGH